MDTQVNSSDGTIKFGTIYGIDLSNRKYKLYTGDDIVSGNAELTHLLNTYPRIKMQIQRTIQGFDNESIKSIFIFEDQSLMPILIGDLPSFLIYISPFLQKDEITLASSIIPFYTGSEIDVWELLSFTTIRNNNDVTRYIYFYHKTHDSVVKKQYVGMNYDLFYYNH